MVVNIVQQINKNIQKRGIDGPAAWELPGFHWGGQKRWAKKSQHLLAFCCQPVPLFSQISEGKTIINVMCVQSLLFLWSTWIFSNCNSLNSRRDNPGWLLNAPLYSQISGKEIMQCDIYAMCLLESFPIATVEAAEIIRADCTRVLICRWHHQGA